MLSMRAAANLLAASTSVEGLAALLRAARIADAGLDAADSATCDALGLSGASEARLGAGPGTIRVLAMALNGDGGFRDAVHQLASRLGGRAPHVLWVLGVVDRDRRTAAIAGWTADGRSRRIASFRWEPGNVVDSDAETLCALAGTHAADDEVAHARYMEILGRGSLTRRFYRALEAQVDSLASAAPRASRDSARTIALITVSRLLFLSFLEAKGWLNGERAFLASRYDDAMRGRGEFHRRVLLPLFFGTLNTAVRVRAPAARAFGRVPFLNGGLFARTPVERHGGRWYFPDDLLGDLFTGLFQRYRFVAREDTATWSEASVDPEMLGRAFESLMARDDRKAGGVFFTPHELVARVADEALRGWDGDARGLRHIRVLDPACGSGAFLVYVLERIADRRRAAGERESVSAIRRDVLARSIFGVDRDPTAVWLCELRLWLSVVIELDETDAARIPPLPNLDRNIRVGDSLAGAAFGDIRQHGTRRVAGLRARYVRASGRRKASLAVALDREERQRTLVCLDREIRMLQHDRREQVASARSRDLFGERSAIVPKADRRRLRGQLRSARSERQRVALGGALPFSFSALFAETQAAGGFDIALGNPPWVRLHRIPEPLRARFRETFSVYRSASWAAGASSARAGSGFASQVDLSALFVERALDLLRPGGVLSLLLPVKLWQSLAGGGVRQLLLTKSQLLRLEDLTGARHAFDAAVYPSIVVARRADDASEDLTIARAGPSGYREWRTRSASLPFDATPGAPWLLLAPPARAAFARVRDAGIPLADSAFGAPRLGVKTGCNAAFVLRVADAGARYATVEDTDGERGKVETHLLRPALRGDSVTPWTRRASNEWILWTHDERGPLARLPAQARQWLHRRYGELATRADAARSRRWWSLYRVDAASSDRARVVWADFGTRPRALVIPPHDPVVPLNTCYVVRCGAEVDAWALAALLNSRLAAAWLNGIAEYARGGYRRYLGWTVGQLPIPARWPDVRDDLAAAAARAAAGSLDDEALLAVVLAAYSLRLRDVRDLVETCDR